MAKEVGSTDQTRKTSAEWAVSTETFPQGHRLMNTTTGEVRVSKGSAGNTWATAWTYTSEGGAAAWGAITGTLADQLDLNNRLETIESALTTETNTRTSVDSALDDEKADLLMPPTIITGNTAYSAGDRFLLNVNTGSHPEYTLPASPTNGLVLKFGGIENDMVVVGNGKNIISGAAIGATATVDSASAMEIVFSTSADAWLVLSTQGTVTI